MQWNFYLSGILYGKFYVKDNDIFVEKLDAAKGIWYPKETFTEESDDFFKKLCSRSLLDFFKNKKEYEEKISEGADEFTASSGETFSNRRNEVYFQRQKKFPKDLFYDEDGIYAVLMSGRDFAAVLVKNGEEDRTILSRWKKAFPEPPAAVNFLGTFLWTQEMERSLQQMCIFQKEKLIKSRKFPLY